MRKNGDLARIGGKPREDEALLNTDARKHKIRQSKQPRCSKSKYAKSIQSDWDSSDLPRLTRELFLQKKNPNCSFCSKKFGCSRTIYRLEVPALEFKSEFQPLDIKVKSAVSAVRDTIRKLKRDEKGPIDKQRTTWEGADE
ncbi:hypothetical protein B0H17DRAFT_1127189 [Mycena rosella]|uniref:Uncharacterized protein n=1 Tax=Mycena rosella TaxID=1033263 RepID=A0AAD7GR81_MYCRO|nr:hypothetical protein B0H17DRAFT_1127189 [Mycena rosella]